MQTHGTGSTRTVTVCREAATLAPLSPPAAFAVPHASAQGPPLVKLLRANLSQVILSTEGRLPPGTGDDVWGHSIVTARRCMQPASSGSRPKMLLRCRPPHRRGWRGTRSAVPKTRGPVPGRALRGDRASSCHALTGHAPGERGCSRSACTRGRPACGSRSALQGGSCRTDSETCADRRRGGSPPSRRICVWQGAGPGSVLGRFQAEVTQAVFSHGDISSRPPGLSPLQGL